MTRPFTNAITGQNGALIRDRIKSPNFVTGVSGWSINKDGTAEFLNALIRGDVVVGGATPPNLELTETIPAELVTFYGTNWSGTIGDFVIKMSVDASNYCYELLLATSSVGPARAVGTVIAGSVVESVIMYVSAGVAVVDYGDFSPSRVRMFGNNLLGDNDTAGSDMQFGSVSLPRGLVYSQSLVSFTFNSTTSLTEQLALTTLTMRLDPGRAFQFRMRTGKKSAVAQAPGYNIHKTNLAGTSLIGGRVDISLAGFDLESIREGIFLNSTGSIVNAALAVGIQPSTATIVTLDTGTGSGSGWIEVYDIGAASAYPGRPTV